MNWYAITYGVVIALLSALLVRSLRMQRSLVRWRRVIAWLVTAGLGSLAAWTLVGCSAWPLVAGGPTYHNAQEVGACMVITAYFAGYMLLVFIPPYALLLSIYASGRGREEGGRRQVLLASALLALPGAVALLLGYALPVNFGWAHAATVSLAPAILCWVSICLGLVAPRLLLRRLGPGELVSAAA